MSSPRVAFFTPLNPRRGGISDHSEELLPYLGELMEVDIVIDKYRPTNGEILQRFRVIQAQEFLKDPSPYDVTIYQVGNHYHHHRYMIPCMKACPGILVLQDYCMQYLILGLTLRAGDLQALIDSLEPIYGDESVVLAKKLLLHSVDPRKISFAAPLIRMSAAVIVHNQYALQLVSRDHPDKLVRYIPMGVSIPAQTQPVATLKRKYGLSDQDFVLISLSTLSDAKRLDLVLTALCGLRQRYPQLRFVIVGAGSFGASAHRQIRRHGLRHAVIQTGWVSPEQYREFTQLADVVLDLRQTTGAETASSLLRGMAAGKPCIVSAQGTFLELPDDFCLKIPVDGNTVKSLEEAIEMLLTDEQRCMEMGKAARRFAESKLGVDLTAKGYLDFTKEVCGSPGDWHVEEALVPSGTGQLAKMVISSVYKILRMVYLYRTYGFYDVIQRLGSELGGQRHLIR